MQANYDTLQSDVLAYDTVRHRILIAFSHRFNVAWCSAIFLCGMEIRGVKIGDTFADAFHTYEVVDFHEVRSMVSGEIIDYKCVCRGVNTLATNRFNVPFATVKRYQLTGQKRKTSFLK